MKSIIRETFEETQKKCPNASSYICFAKTVKICKMNDKEMTKWFNLLVEKNDYLRSEKLSILEHLKNIKKKTEGFEEDKN